MQNKKFGLIDNWLHHIKDIYHKHQKELSDIRDVVKRVDKFCEINVIEQVYNVCQTTIIQTAWDRGQSLSVHGWIYELETGYLKDLGQCISDKNQISKTYQIG